MSVHVMSWVLRNSNARLGDRLVLLVLADHAKDDGTSAWPSVATIASEAHLSPKQVQRCLASLKRAKRITNTGASRSGTNVYSVEMTEKRERGDILSGATNPTQERDRMSPEPSLVQTSEEHTLAAAPRKRDEIWDSLAEIFGTPTTRSAETRRGKVVSSLRRAGATPDEVFGRARRWALHYPNATMTDTALESHWDTLPRKPLRRTA